MLKKYFHPHLIEAGCDEAGRGCLAGPVFAAAVILPKKFHHPLINDSKKLSEKQRNKLAPLIKEASIAFCVEQVDNAEIDRINILNASFLAMHKALEKLSTQPELILVDGNRFREFKNIPHHCIVKGDGKYQSIAAASILAKTYRDEFMLGLHEKFPYYHWDKNKGYPTQKHREGILNFGESRYHRKSFRLLNLQLEIPLETSVGKK